MNYECAILSGIHSRKSEHEYEHHRAARVVRLPTLQFDPVVLRLTTNTTKVGVRVSISVQRFFF